LMLKTTIRLLLLGFAIAGIIALVRTADELGLTLFILGIVGFVILGLASLVDRWWSRE
jgi:hypothetical protein